MAMDKTVTTDLLERALALHQAGHLDHAKGAYLQLLAQDPAHADALHLLGVLFGQLGQVAEAVSLVEQAITKNPRYSPYHNNLGNLLKRQGEQQRARASYHRAIRLDRRNADAYLNLGKLQHEMGDLISSRDSLNSALSLAPASIETLMSLGRLEEACGNLRAAAARFENVIELAPDCASAHLMLARCWAAGGHSANAEVCLTKAIALDPGYADAYYNLGNLERSRNRLQSAVAAYWRAIELAPLVAADAYNNLGLTFLALERPEDAMSAYMKAIALKPTDDAAFINLGRLSVTKGNDDAAVQLFQKAIALNPNNVGAYQDMAAIYARHGEQDEAVRLCRIAMDLAPPSLSLRIALGTLLAQMGNPEGSQMIESLFAIQPFTAETHFHVYMNLGVVRKNEGRLEEAIECYRAAAMVPSSSSADLENNLGIALALHGNAEGIAMLEKLVRKHPRSAVYHFNLGVALLTHDRYSKGWAEFEWWRKVERLQKDSRPVEVPRWLGDSLDGRSILLYAEQGFGDTLQFIRYIPQVLARGGRVVLMVQDPLVRLLKDLPGIVACIPVTGPIPACDVSASLMSLPRLCKTTFESIPPPAYLGVPPRRPSPANRPYQVGLVWAGSPRHSMDRIRSISLDQFRPLAGLGEVAFTSLQIGPVASQIDAPGQSISFVADCSHVKDFADTAEIIAGLDLVITIDSAVAHLAGSMAKPVWMLHAVVPDWRWGLTSNETAWYPTAKLFRQAEIGDWQPVMQQICSELAEEARRHTASTYKELLSA
ncbi:tetratricopeptide repeat protein [Granulicella sibirica]|uniref:Uncharacterized protein n=1 Tax=Granulicella sibirica TaxID=2479048 RepID=A0A4Q0T0U6_9BACT|nr:tetratricopeptide repeat protein [Granulicella sibirica]RXH57225.1 hypothetical protein GRAN_0535 [Granulicella sibirica]